MRNFKLLNDNQSSVYLTYLQSLYKKRINFYGIQRSDLNRFSWSENKKVCIYGIKIYIDFATSTDKSATLVFATENDTCENKLLFYDAFNITKNPRFIDVSPGKDMLNWLINNNFINKNITNKIIEPSLHVLFGPFGYLPTTPFAPIDLIDTWIKTWVDKEYKSSLDIERNTTQVNNFPLKQKHYFIDRYHFEDMLKEIDNDQFTDELNQCLFAYENEKWFLCASGLGSCLEHLMYIILSNYNKRGYKTLKAFPKDPTARDYINRFTKDPINIDSRQARAINLFFMARNTVDHYNSGKTQRIFCDLLLDGISDVYNDYFGKSKSIPNI